MGGYDGTPSMNHFKFMEIDDCTNFSFFGCFVRLPFLIYAIPCHFHHFHIHTLGDVNEGLQVFILLHVSQCPKTKCPKFSKIIGN